MLAVEFFGVVVINEDELLFYNSLLLFKDRYLTAEFYWTLALLGLVVSVGFFFWFLLMILIYILSFEVPISFSNKWWVLA